MTLPSTRTTALLLACLAAVAAVGGAVGVPDARITVDSIDAGPTDPVVGERTAVNVTVASSAGSAEPTNVTELRLLDADGEARDVAVAPGALSPGDALDATLWTTFDEPGEHRLTVEVVATEPIDEDVLADADDADDDADEEPEPPVVRVQRDIVVDVEPAESTVDIRIDALSPEDLRDGDGEGDAAVDVGGIGGIEGILGGGGAGGLDAGDDEPVSEAVSSPVAVTVVNTGTVPADRVSLTATGAFVDDDTSGGDTSSDASGDASGDTDGSSNVTVDVGPFVVEDVAPGEERRVIVDLGPLDRRSNVTVTAAFRSSATPPDGDGAARTVEASIVYPPREASPEITGTTVTHEGDDRVVVDANLANVGDRAIEGVVVDVAETEGVAATPDGGAYFIGVVGESDFVPFELGATANASVADTVPLRVEYTDRGVRYVETVHVDLPPPPEDDGSDGRFAVLSGGNPGPVALAVGLAGVIGLAVAGLVARRRYV